MRAEGLGALAVLEGLVARARPLVEGEARGCGLSPVWMRWCTLTHSLPKKGFSDCLGSPRVDW